MTDLSQFHHLDAKGYPSSVYDYKIFEHICEKQNLFVLGGIPYFYGHGVYRPDTYGTKLKTEIRKCIYPELIRSTTIDRIYKLFLSADELRVSPDDLNNYPEHWINFRNHFYDPVKEEFIPHSPSYRAVNQIPHDLKLKDVSGKNIDEWLEFIAPDPYDREMLLQYCGYSMTRDTRQQKFLILEGVGGTGKSTLISLLEKVIGTDNISNVSLKELSGKFSAFGLMGKLLNSCADIEVSALEDASIVKQVCGEDRIKGESKGKDQIWFHSYAKMIFSTNELPVVLSEKTEGFYRKLIILTMNKKPKVKNTDFLNTLLNEIDYFILLCVQALGRMYKAGIMTESDNSIASVKRMWHDSDTVTAWLQDDTDTTDPEVKIKMTFLFERYKKYCERVDRTALKVTPFYKSLELKGYKQKKTDHGTRYFLGIKPNEIPFFDD